MQLFNKKILDTLERKERYLPFFYKTSFAIGVIVLIFLANDFFDRRTIKYRNSNKTPVTGTFKSSAFTRGGVGVCFFEIDGDGLVPINCKYSFYSGQKVNLIKVTKTKGGYYYVIGVLPP